VQELEMILVDGEALREVGHSWSLGVSITG
jgi:hypothetical protein